MEPSVLLVVARTQSLVKRLSGSVSAERFVVRWVPSAARALEFETDPALLLFEVPPTGGCRSIPRLKRRFPVPLMAIGPAASSKPKDVDAYLGIPCETTELMEAIEWLLMDSASYGVHAQGMSLDIENGRLQMNGSIHHLRPTGTQILACLMSKAGCVVSRSELYRKVWAGNGGDDTRALDVHIAYLRRKLETDPRRPRIILTEWGVGYRLQPPPCVVMQGPGGQSQ